MHKFARYVISGVAATATNLFIAYLFTDVLGIWYVLSTAVGFCIALSVSFGLQKFWTFRHNELARVHMEATQFVLVAVAGLAFNTAFVYTLVEYSHFNYLIAQICSGVFVAVANFFFYHFIFHRKRASLSSMWNEELNEFGRGIVIAGGIAIALLALKLLGIGLPLHQDEWKTARVILEGAAASGTYFQHPPLAGLLFRAAGTLVPPELFRLLPLFFTAASYALFYLILEARVGVRAGILSIALFGTVAYGTLAALMFDIDGAILPFFMLLAVYAYDRWRNSVGRERILYAVLLFAALTLGFLVKLSFVIVVGAILLDYLYERRKDITAHEIWRIGGLLALFIAIAGISIAGASFVYPAFDTNGMVSHALSYVRGFHRNWAQVVFEGVKSFLYIGPLAFAWLPFASRENVERTRIFLIYLGLGFLFYFVLFDFSQGALDKYLMFTIVPLCAIAGVTLAGHLPRRSECTFGYIVTLIIGGFFILALNFLPHDVLSLYPKAQWATHVLSLHWNILIPFMGGSGPTGFYVSFLFIVASFIVSGGVAFLAFARPGLRSLAVGALLVLSFLYAGVFTEEFLFGRINGSTTKVVREAVAYIHDSNEVSTIITHNDIGAFELWQMGKYAGRFYAVPQYEDEHRALFASHTGQYLVVDMPRWSEDSFYAKFFSSCRATFSSSSGVISARVYVCPEAAAPHK
ncbi:MAG: GtrA family protein [Candidatus Paceibacterota bacterium]